MKCLFWTHPGVRGYVGADLYVGGLYLIWGVVRGFSNLQGLWEVLLVVVLALLAVLCMSLSTRGGEHLALRL